MSKVPLDFEMERLEECAKPTRVGVEELEMLAGSLRRISHTETKVTAKRIKIEKPSRLVIQRKLPEEVLRIEMLKHVARVDDLTLEILHGHAVLAINVLFKDSSSELTRALGIRTCAESPAMLTKWSHVTALCVVAARTQIAAIAGYEEWGKWHTVWKLL
ncbi:hypothetical protein M404DRAFT_26400 [Pisolithus tinctorius Marx 270]|uniref:Uncharacterized protein n=1 Tax=Pisolithus tinctorius Marx 270 TaxID=870435 RepID=A0A0C3P9H0_PISTI|nr:hypothetical protein M404DRAFT_26400 [Pisolithus tinctorius Marx 270]